MRELQVVVSAVEEAAQLLRAEAARPDGPRGGGTKAPVDEEVGAILCERIGAIFPDDHIICEEGGGQKGSSDRAFHIDPHDGTRDFLNGRRETSISVGLVQNGQFLLGVVFAPMTVPLFDGGELLVTWAIGEPMRVNGEPIEIPKKDSPTALTEDSLVLISTRIQNQRFEANCAALAPARVEHCASIATRLALVAIGRADAGFTMNHTLHGWDFAGGQALLEAAGGALATPEGKSLRWNGFVPESTIGYFGARSVSLAADIASRMGGLLEK